MYRGAHNFGAEIGHFTVERDGPLCACGERGHWEAIASGTALGRMARELVAEGGDAGGDIVEAAGGDVDAVTGIHVGEAARAGDPDAIALLRAVRRQRVARARRALEHPRPGVHRDRGRSGRARPAAVRAAAGVVRRHIEGATHRPTIAIVPAELGERAGAVGAAVLARSLLP